MSRELSCRAADLHFSYRPSRWRADQTLLLLNSLGTSVEIWDPLLADLERAGNLVRLDYPGHGGSRSDGSRTLDDIARRALDVADVLGVERFHVAGISIGGIVSTRLAAIAPDRVASLAAVGAPAVADRDSWEQRARTVEEHGVVALVPTLMRRWFTPELRAARPDLVAHYSRIVQSTPDAVYARYSRMMAEVDVRPDLGLVRCPAVIVSGGRDPAATAEDAAMYVAGIADVREVVIEDAAHMMPATHAEQLQAILVGHVHRASA